MKVSSPMAIGNGAYIVHKTLEKYISNYHVIPYSPYRTLMPFLLYHGLKDRSANLIHTTPDYAHFFAQSNKPLVLTFHNFMLDDFMQNHSNFLQKIHYKTDLKWFTQLALQQATCITAVSQFTANLAKKTLGTTKEIKVIYNGINADFFIPKYKNNNNKINVLFCGNLTHRKGAHLLPKISEKLSPNITIHYTAGLRTKNKAFQRPQLKCIGRINYADMPAVYQQSDILLLPTVREGLVLAGIEAMACGLPIVATNCSSMPELVDENQGGFLCPLEQVDEFAEKINLLADNFLLRKQMGEYNRTKVEQQFTLSRMINSYQNLFEETLS